jgi:NlpE N-terminal domain
MARSLRFLVLCLLVGGCFLRKVDPFDATAGVYHARLPAADSSGRIVTLWLERAGTAVLETVYVGKGQAPVEHGRWSVRDDQVTVVLLDQDDRPTGETLVFTKVEERLVPKDWNHERYGDTGLPLTRRGGSR